MDMLKEVTQYQRLVIIMFRYKVIVVLLLVVLTFVVFLHSLRTIASRYHLSIVVFCCIDVNFSSFIIIIHEGIWTFSMHGVIYNHEKIASSRILFVFTSFPVLIESRKTRHPSRYIFCIK